MFIRPHLGSPEAEAQKMMLVKLESILENSKRPTHSAPSWRTLATGLFDNSVVKNKNHYWGTFLPIAIRRYSTYLSPSCARPHITLSCQPGLE